VEDEVTRSIRLTIAPATATYCGFVRTRCLLAKRVSLTKPPTFKCSVFRTGDALVLHEGMLMRWPECIAAEDLAPR
jgi:hypothetical protein